MDDDQACAGTRSAPLVSAGIVERQRSNGSCRFAYRPGHAAGRAFIDTSPRRDGAF
jgi:hypothetical protein